MLIYAFGRVVVYPLVTICCCHHTVLYCRIQQETAAHIFHWHLYT